MKAQIVSDPKILGGKPTIAGTRISVELILDRVASGMSIEEVLMDYPRLSREQVQAALTYASKLVKSKKQARNKESSVTLYTHEISR